jgi:hypothetical protein
MVKADHPIGEYIIPPSDARGRHVNFSVSCPPEMRRIASVLLQSHKFPFETESDVLRWCVYFGLQTLTARSKDKDVGHELSQLDSWLRISVHKSEMLYYEETLNLNIGTVEDIASRGHISEALSMAEQMWRESDNLGDVYWTKRCRAKAHELVLKLRKMRKGKEDE